MKVRKLDHVSVIVRDLPAAVAFFLDLGLELQVEMDMQGEVLDRVNGLDGVNVSMAMLGTADGQATLELIQFHSPLDEGEIRNPLTNTPGIRHIAFLVEDVDGILAKLQTRGAELVGETINYATSYRLCFLRGPEGMILELAERIG